MVKTFDYQKHKILACDETPQFRLNPAAKEPETIEFLEKYIKEDSYFVNVGANCGAYSLIAASLGAKVAAFEPAVSNFYLLLKNVDLNCLKYKVKLFPFVISEYTGLTLFVYKDLELGSTHGLHWGGSIKTFCYQYTLDDLLKGNYIQPPDVILIDTDGNENAVLCGMSYIFLNCPPKAIQIECSEDNLFNIKTWITGEYGYKVEKETVRNNPQFVNVKFVKD